MKTILDHFLATKKSHHTQRAYRSDIKRFLEGGTWFHIPFSQFLQVSQGVISEEVQKYLSSCQRIDEHQGHVTNPRTVNRKWASLSSFFTYLVTWHEYPKNPLDYFSQFPVHRKSNTEALTQEETQKVLTYLKERAYLNQTAHRDYLIVRFLLHYALRRSELASLTWKSIKSHRGTMEIIQKGNHIHEIPILCEDWKLLLEYRDRFSLSGEFVFQAVERRKKGLVSKPISTSYIYKLVRKTTEALIPGSHFTPHSFRTTFVSEALAHKIGVHEIANATGHHDIHMVRYYDRRDAIENNAITQLNSLLTSKQEVW